MLLLIKTKTYTDGCDDTPEVAVLELTKEGIERILAWCEKSKKEHEEDASFYKMEFFDYTPVYLSGTEREGDLSDQVEEGSAVVITDAPAGNPVNMDCSILNVTADEIFWSGYLKHTNILVETNVILVETLQELKEAA